MSGISYSTLAGSYGLSAQTLREHAAVTRCARDILILKPDGSYAVFFAAQRILATGGTSTANLSGSYTLADDGMLLLTGSGDAMTGQVEKDGSILLRSTAKNASVRKCWRAKKIDCIWPNCRNCRGYQWHYCVRAAR